MSRIGVSTLAFLVTICVPASTAHSAEKCRKVDCETAGNGLLVAAAMLRLPGGHVAGTAQQFWDYGTAQYCVGPIPDAPGGVDCQLMHEFCNNQPGDGPAVWVFQRKIRPETPWLRQGYTCYPNLIPGTVDFEQIAEAFHSTDLAVPVLGIQPPRNRTLVTLPTYFAVDWRAEGFEPEELDPLNPRDWFGMQITIKPVLQSITYDFGDGTREGPTTSTGGPYPSGDIVKTYEAAGTYRVRADAVYKGFVMIDGSDWIEIPGEVSIPGPPEDLAVLTANNSLYLPGG